MDGPIVVGTDGSDTAAKAVEEAIRLAGLLERALLVVSVTSGPDARVEAVLKAAAERGRAAGVKTETYSRTGDPSIVLVELAKEARASMLVVGNQGIGSKKRFVLANVPSKVVHNAPCSTLVVHTG